MALSEGQEHVLCIAGWKPAAMVLDIKTYALIVSVNG